MQLELLKSICFIDLETTGLNLATARIIEISILKVEKNGVKTTYTKLINPECAIPPETTLIHNITDEDVKDKPTFKNLAKEIFSFIGNSDLGGYNILKFDLPLLAEEFLRANIVLEISDRNIIDVQNIFHKMEPRNLAAAYNFYCSKKLENAHSAEADITATYEIFLAQVEKYSSSNDSINMGFPENISIENLANFSVQKKFVDLAGNIVLNKNNVAVFNFGKYKEKSVLEVFTKEPQYYDWIQKSDFPEYTKKVFQKIYFQKFENEKNSLSQKN